jgi:hypothetical protein
VAVYALYAGGVVAWRYFLLSSLAEDALHRELPTLTERQVPGLAPQVEPGARLARVRDRVLQGAAQAEVPLSADEVAVSADGNVLTVRVRCEYAVLRYEPHRLAIPISVERSLAVP